MSRLDQAPEVINLAKELGIGVATPVKSILSYCRNRIDGWVAESGGVRDIETLESLVTQRLQMIFEEIKTDEDFDRITEMYAKAKKDPVFATMRYRFDDPRNPTYGALVQRRNVTAQSPDRFVAVIDCRGSKLARRFFTRWHEIAHRLTTHADLPEPEYRSEHDPIERLMDEIAGHVGFYEPLFEPAYCRASHGKSLLSFDTVQSVLSSSFAAASFQATLFACARRVPTPVLYVEAAIGHKKEVKKKIEDKSLRLFADEPPPGEWRAVKVVPNTAAQQEKFMIPTNMRVPAGSVLYCLSEAEPLTDCSGREDLNSWEDSKGKRLEKRAVVVEARKVPDRVIAIVQPVGSKTKTQQAKPFFSD